MNAGQKSAVPFVWILIPYITGITLGLLADIHRHSNLLIFALVLVIGAFIVINLLYKPLRIYRVNWLGGLFLFILMNLAGALTLTLSKQINRGNHFSKRKADYLVVTIDEEPSVKNKNLRFTAVVEQTVYQKEMRHTIGRLMVAIPAPKKLLLNYGDVLLIPAKYNTVEPPYNPAEFNYKHYLANKNIYHQAYIYPGQYRIIDHQAGNPIISYALMLRQYLVYKLKSNITDADAASVASTLILGYKADLSSDVLQAYSKTGTVHVLSVSGAHVALVYGVLLFLLSPLGNGNRQRVVKTVVIIVLIWLYALLTGFSPPVCRAAIMLSLIIMGRTYGRHISMLNILAFSAFILLLFDPLLLTDVGFQLSYLAVAGLIILQPLIYKRLQPKNKWLDKLWLVSSASIAAQAATLPLSVYYFHQVPVYFLVSNLIIIIPSAIILCGGLLYLFMPQNFILTHWLGEALNWLIVGTNKTLIYIEHLPLASINKIWINKIEYVLLYAILIIVTTYLLNKKKKWLAYSGALFLLLILSSATKHYRSAREKEMVFMNLRKNTAIICRQGKKAFILTDLDSTNKSFLYSVQPYIDSAKINNVKLIPLKSDVNNGHLIKQGNFISFNDQRILIINKQSQSSLKITGAIAYLTDNTSIDAKLLQALKPSILIVSPKNNDSYVKNVTDTLNATSMKYYVLKRNKAFILTSNR